MTASFDILLDDPAFRDAILREARNASAVRHPNVVSVDDVEETDDELLLDMDDVEGTSLSHVLASRTALGAPVAVRIVMDVCSALAAEDFCSLRANRGRAPRTMISTVCARPKVSRPRP